MYIFSFFSFHCFSFETSLFFFVFIENLLKGSFVFNSLAFILLCRKKSKKKKEKTTWTFYSCTKLLCQIVVVSNRE